jgi:nucleotide-binding universal stress UspA family protein
VSLRRPPKERCFLSTHVDRSLVSCPSRGLARMPGVHVVAVDGSKFSDTAFAFVCNNTPSDASLVVVSGRDQQEQKVVGEARAAADARFAHMMDYYRTKCVEANRECTFETLEFTSVIGLGKSIHAVADKHDADTIVVGSRGLSSAQGLFMGSVSSAVLHAASRPVTVVKKG